MGSASSGTSCSVSNTIGMTVTGISMMTVPETIGVNIRLSNDSRHAIANWNSDDTTIRLAIIAGPPDSSALTQTAMNAPDVPIIRMCPAPIRPTLTACRMVVKPDTNRAANTPQAM